MSVRFKIGLTLVAACALFTSPGAYAVPDGSDRSDRPTPVSLPAGLLYDSPNTKDRHAVIVFVVRQCGDGSKFWTIDDTYQIASQRPIIDAAKPVPRLRYGKEYSVRMYNVNTIWYMPNVTSSLIDNHSKDSGPPNLYVNISPSINPGGGSGQLPKNFTLSAEDLTLFYKKTFDLLNKMSVDSNDLKESLEEFLRSIASPSNCNSIVQYDCAHAVYDFLWHAGISPKELPKTLLADEAPLYFESGDKVNQFGIQELPQLKSQYVLQTYSTQLGAISPGGTALSGAAVMFNIGKIIRNDQSYIINDPTNINAPFESIESLLSTRKKLIEAYREDVKAFKNGSGGTDKHMNVISDFPNQPDELISKTEALISKTDELIKNLEPKLKALMLYNFMKDNIFRIYPSSLDMYFATMPSRYPNADVVQVTGSLLMKSGSPFTTPGSAAAAPTQLQSVTISGVPLDHVPSAADKNSATTISSTTVSANVNGRLVRLASAGVVASTLQNKNYYGKPGVDAGGNAIKIVTQGSSDKIDANFGALVTFYKTNPGGFSPGISLGAEGSNSSIRLLVGPSLVYNNSKSAEFALSFGLAYGNVNRLANGDQVGSPAGTGTVGTTAVGRAGAFLGLTVGFHF